MSTWVWILIVLILGFVAFVQSDDQVAKGSEVARITVPVMSEEWEPVTVGEVEGVIVTPDEAPLLVDSLGLDLDSSAYWLPTPADVEAAERALTDEAGELEHTRQHARYIEDGNRKIYINGFCDASGVEWQERPVLVQDGGDCFFTAIYNVDAGELERFRFNGEA